MTTDDLKETAKLAPPRNSTESVSDAADTSTVIRRGRDVATASHPALPAAAAVPLTEIGRYTVLEVIGEGGMGVVYAAYDPQLDRKVAVKVLRGDAQRKDPQARDRMLREAQALARVSHPNIVTVHEITEPEPALEWLCELSKSDR